jgi:hypothetical protein
MIPSLTSGVAPAEYFPPYPEAPEAGHPGSLELLHVRGVDLLQRGVPLIGQVTAVGDPILADGL